MVWNILCSRGEPVIRAWNGELCPAVDLGGNDHGLISGENGLTKGNGLSTLVLCAYCTGTVHTVWLIGKGLADLAVLVAVESTILSVC